MQKIIRNNTITKRLAIAFIILVVLVAGATVYATMNNIGPFANKTDADAENSVNYGEPSDEQREAGS